MIIVGIILLSLSIFCSSHTTDGQDHECYRPCVVNQTRQCFYEFNVESYWVLSNACYNCPNNSTDCDRHDCIPADGFERMIQVVNRKLPGPSIQVCYGDEIIVLVKNRMKSEITSIHWHGLQQRGSQHMDGVPFVTQCPIHPESSFVYRFRAAQFGTHQWHSHSSVQRGNGIVGSLIIRRPPEFDKKNNAYDYDLPEHVIVIQDWTEDDATKVSVRRYHITLYDSPRTILVNGRGLFVGGVPNNTAGIRPPTFVVAKGFKYRFRIINAGFMAMPIVITIDNHKMKVIAADGVDIVPIDTDVLTCYSGERYDIVIDSNQSIGAYWMKFQGLVLGYNLTYQGAVLQYKESSANMPTPQKLTYETAGSLISNPLNMNGYLSPPNNTPIDQLSSWYNYNINSSEPVRTIYIDYDVEEVIDDQFQLSQPSPTMQTDALGTTRAPRFNNLALLLPPYPLLSQATQQTETEYCNNEIRAVPESCKTRVCRCLHVIKIQPNTWVELILIDRGLLYDVTHPIHLHGYYFHVLGMERLGNSTTLEQVKDLNNRGLLKRNFRNPIKKDTITVPDGGYAVLRFFADNIGFWLFHCHIDFHSDLGMGLVFQVGELHEMPRPPPHFPSCGNYTEAWIPPPANPVY